MARLFRTTTPLVLVTAGVLGLGVGLLAAGIVIRPTLSTVSGIVATTRGSSYSDELDSYGGIRLTGDSTEYMTPVEALMVLRPGDRVTLWITSLDDVEKIRIDSGPQSGHLFTTESFKIMSAQLNFTNGISLIAGAFGLVLVALLVLFWFGGGHLRLSAIRSDAALRWREVAVLNPAISVARLGLAFVTVGLIFWPVGTVVYEIAYNAGAFGPSGPSFPQTAVGLSIALPSIAAVLGLVAFGTALASFSIGPRTTAAHWALWTGLLLAVGAGSFWLVVGALLLAG
jgi:hypothetical protein